MHDLYQDGMSFVLWENDFPRLCLPPFVMVKYDIRY
jgi:hypothetical protein